MRKFTIEDMGMEFETEEEVAEYITDRMGDEVYDDMLDECYGEVEICGYTYSTSHALYQVDEVAYNCGRRDYYDSLRCDMVYELERMGDGDTSDFYGFEVECTEEDDEDEDDEELEEDMDEPDVDETGFDPYEGCYTNDC